MKEHDSIIKKIYENGREIHERKRINKIMPKGRDDRLEKETVDILGIKDRFKSQKVKAILLSDTQVRNLKSQYGLINRISKLASKPQLREPPAH